MLYGSVVSLWRCAVVQKALCNPALNTLQRLHFTPGGAALVGMAR